MFEIIIQFLIGVLTPIIFIGGIIAVLNELIQSFEKKEEYNRKLEELEEEIKEFSSQNQTLVEDCKSTIREIELEHQKTIQSLSRCSQSLYNEANAVLKNTHDLMIINGLLSERIQTLLKYATTSLEPEQESKLIEEITSAINHIKMENEQIAHHRQELEKAMRDIEQHDLEVAQKQELKEIQGHHFGGLSILYDKKRKISTKQRASQVYPCIENTIDFFFVPYYAVIRCGKWSYLCCENRYWTGHIKKSKHCSSATHSYYYVALLRFIDYLYFCKIDN